MTSNRHPQRERPRTSRVSRLALVAALAWTLPARAPAQQTGTVEGGAFARYTDFDHSLALARSVGAGGRVGVFVRPNVAVELDLSSASATRAGGASVSHAPLHAWLVYSPSLNPRATLLFGGGIGRPRYGVAAACAEQREDGRADAGRLHRVALSLPPVAGRCSGPPGW